VYINYTNSIGCKEQAYTTQGCTGNRFPAYYPPILYSSKAENI